MHGFAVLKLLSLLLGHFWASGRLAGGRWGTLGVWVVGGGLIVGVELSSGFEGWLPAALVRSPTLPPCLACCTDSGVSATPHAQVAVRH